MMKLQLIIIPYYTILEYATRKTEELFLSELQNLSSEEISTLAFYIYIFILSLPEKSFTFIFSTNSAPLQLKIIT